MDFYNFIVGYSLNEAVNSFGGAITNLEFWKFVPTGCVRRRI